jgi:hypothetical protein
VLFSARLRDFFMYLTVGFVFQPKWTDKIHEEWMENVLEQRPHLTREQFERTRNLMDQHGRDWRVPFYEHLVDDIVLPDADDRHVVAAAIASNAPTIVTFNLSDFPNAALTPLGIRALHPDDFACLLLQEREEEFRSAVRAHRLSLRNPPRTVEEYLDALQHSGLPEMACRLAAFRDEI